jgi:hypothetical protein
MPTGYTANIEDGRITTGKEFLMLCARAFGACLDMRDEPLSEPIPFEFTPSPHLEKRIAETEKNLSNLLSLTIDDAQTMLDKEYRDNQRRYAEAVERGEKIRQKYKAIREEVERWEPPTPEHKELKKFALNQIAISGDDDWSFYETEKPKENVKEWLQAKIDCEKAFLERYQNDWQEEVERTNNKNKWLSALRESLS